MGEADSRYAGTRDNCSDMAIRPPPQPPHCRGILVEDGLYTGCAYGYGDLAPFTGPCDCPVCYGTGIEGGVIGTILPHSSFGDESCCGCLNGVVRGRDAEIRCNECEAVIQTVPTSELQSTLNRLELGLDLASALCPYCGSAHLAPGFSKLMVFVCENCHNVVTLSDDQR
jgi:hypothetical protein